MQIEIALCMDYDEITDSYFVKGGMNLERGKLVLERDFSELGALQSAHTIRYCCESDESGCELLSSPPTLCVQPKKQVSTRTSAKIIQILFIWKPPLWFYCVLGLRKIFVSI